MVSCAWRSSASRLKLSMGTPKLLAISTMDSEFPLLLPSTSGPSLIQQAQDLVNNLKGLRITDRCPPLAPPQLPTTLQCLHHNPSRHLPVAPGNRHVERRVVPHELAADGHGRREEVEPEKAREPRRRAVLDLVERALVRQDREGALEG